MSGWASGAGLSGGLLAGALLGVITTAAAAQQPRPISRELGVQLLATVADPGLAGGGVYAALRPGGNARFALTLTAGQRDQRLAGRGELLAHFVVNPSRVRGLGLYGLGGLAAVVQRETRGFLVLGVGIETASGRHSGWAIEAGAGDGVRLSAGWRRRW